MWGVKLMPNIAAVTNTSSDKINDDDDGDADDTGENDGGQNDDNKDGDDLQPGESHK